MGYKVLFLTFSTGGRGFWLRYTSLSGLRRSYSAFWATVFGYGRPRGFTVKSGELLNISETSVVSVERLFSLYEGFSRAMFQGLKWDLRFTPSEGVFNPIPLIYRVLRRSSKYLIANPNTTFKGVVSVMGEEFSVDHRGMIGYVSGDRYLHHWAWSHCSGFDEDPDGWLDILVASPDGRRRVLFGMVKHEGKLLHVGRIMGAPFRGELGLEKFKAEAEARGYKLKLEVEASRENIIVAKYEDPVEGYRYCHNTEIASSTLALEGRIGRVRLNCSKRAFYEYALPEKIDGSLQEVIEV